MSQSHFLGENKKVNFRFFSMRVLGIGFCFFLVFLGWLGLELFPIPSFLELRTQVEVPIRLANETKSTKWIGPKTRGWVSLKNMANFILGAVLVSEDASFYRHSGIDLFEMKEALRQDWREKRWARGASTISQQVVKNVYLSQEKTLLRKIKEVFWTLHLEKVLSKPEILCFYLNLVEWGPGIYGILEASRRYFDTDPSQLTAKQAAFLALLLPAPRKYHSYFQTKELTTFAKERIERILSLMYRMGFLTKEEYEAAQGESLWEKELPGEKEERLQEIETQEMGEKKAEGELSETFLLPSSSPSLQNKKKENKKEEEEEKEN